MNGLQTVVCVKVVPRPEEVKVNPDTLTVDRAGARSEFNPPDLCALETALRLRDDLGGTVRVLSMGPPLFEPILRLTLAMGADAVYLLSDRAFAGADTLATSYTLAQGIRRIGGFDLILCGDESSDGATGQVPPGIAEWLGIPQVTYAEHLQVAAGRLLARRASTAGYQVVTAELPCLVSVKTGGVEPRFVDMDRWRWALSEAPVTVWTRHDLDLDPGAIGPAGSATAVAGLRQAGAPGTAGSPARRREFLEGTAAEKARALAERLRPLLH